MAALQKLCAGILIRRNIGYDFAAWREGLDYLKLPRGNTDMLLIANDSVYGPLRPLDPILAQIDFDAAELWGATESWQTRYHLQSYFLLAGRRALTSEAWRRFWQNVRPVQSKQWVIRHYEVGLSQALIRGGMRCAAIWKYTDLIGDVDPALVGGDDDALANDPSLTARRSHAGRIRQGAVSRRPLNPTSDLWRQLLRTGYPFLKRELLRENPTGVLDIAEWRDEVRDKLGAGTELIEADLKEVLRDRAP
jgi:lipopolysaccharide biosynthesis protein